MWFGFGSSGCLGSTIAGLLAHQLAAPHSTPSRLVSIHCPVGISPSSRSLWLLLLPFADSAPITSCRPWRFQLLLLLVFRRFIPQPHSTLGHLDTPPPAPTLILEPPPPTSLLPLLSARFDTVNRNTSLNRPLRWGEPGQLPHDLKWLWTRTTVKAHNRPSMERSRHYHLERSHPRPPRCRPQRYNRRSDSESIGGTITRAIWIHICHPVC